MPEMSSLRLTPSRLISFLFLVVLCYYLLVSLNVLAFTKNLAEQQELREVHIENVTHSPHSLENNLHNQPAQVMNAEVHVGPHKMGSTTIQESSGMYYAQLVEDNYDTPLAHYSQKQKQRLKRFNHVQFGTCFFSQSSSALKPHEKKSKTESVTTVLKFNNAASKQCKPKLLAAGLEIANQTKSILISAEVFDRPDIDIQALSDYLQPWQSVTIVINYRRFYDWIISYNNELYKGGTIIESLYDELNSERKMQEYEMSHTYEVMHRYKQVFDNVTIVNMHDTKNLTEGFYCDAMPDAKTTCENVKKSNDVTSNPSKHLEYMVLLNEAKRRGYIKRTPKSKEYKVALEKVQKHQEETLKLSSDDFAMKCPPPKVLEKLLAKSLHFEKQIVPEFFSSPLGEAALRADFEKKSTRKLCSIDIEAILETPDWREFFKSF